MEEYYDDINELARDIAYGKIKSRRARKFKDIRKNMGKIFSPKQILFPRENPGIKNI